MTDAKADYDNGDKDVISYTQAHLAEVQKKNPNVLFCIARSKNKNIVVYEAKVSNSKFDASTPVEVYWLDIEPSYRETNRKNGIMTDRTELIWIEKSMAYGISCTAVPKKAETFKVNLVSLPDREMVVSINAQGVPEMQCLVNGRECIVTFIYVKSQERTWLPPKCIYVDLSGKSIKDGSVERERIVPK